MKIFCIIFTFFIILFFCIPVGIINYNNIPNILPHTTKNNYAIVFGAAIRSHGRLSPILKERVDDAITLYKQKKVTKLVFSGAYNNEIAPGEPRAMRFYAIKKGVSSKDIILDERGESTYLTIQYVKYLIQRNPKIHIIYVSSYYHIPRIRILSQMVGVKEYQVYFSHKQKTLINKPVLRETVAFWYYLAFYPFYKLDARLTDGVYQ